MERYDDLLDTDRYVLIEVDTKQYVIFDIINKGIVILEDDTTSEDITKAMLDKKCKILQPTDVME